MYQYIGSESVNRKNNKFLYGALEDARKDRVTETYANKSLPYCQ